MKVAGNIVIGNLQQTSTYLADFGTVNTYKVSFNPPITGYTDGLEVSFKAANANTGACSLEVDGYGPRPIVKQVNIDLGVNDILQGEIITVVYDGVNFQISQVQAESISPFSTYRIDGAQVAWQQNYDYLVAASDYVILGSQYSSPQTGITLAAADPTFNRIDLVVTDSNNTVQVITGTPSANPQAPSYDPATQLPVTFLIVEAGTTQPSCAALITVYKEFAGTPTEWAATTNTGHVVLNSINSPRNGTKDIEGTAVPVASTITFTPLTPVNSTNMTQLDLYIKSKGSWGNTGSGKRMSIAFYTSSGQIGGNVIITPRGSFGFNSATTSGYQLVAISRSAFNIPDGQLITSMVITVAGSNGTMGFYLDDISLEQNCNINPPPLTGGSGYSGYSGRSGYSGFSGLGVSGYSGFSGVGVSGYSGFSGIGFSGGSGYSGYSGVSGYSGYSGSGVSGYSGFSGAGTSGYSGYSGTGGSGYSGYSGSGLSGYSGYSGAGLSGYSGYSGLSGYSGYSGSGISGYSGYSGFSGISGYSGFSGTSGYSGFSGFSGFSGAAGTTYTVDNGLTASPSSTNFEIGGTGIKNTNIDWANFTWTNTFNSITNSGFIVSSNSTAAASNLQKLIDLSLSGANASSNQTTFVTYISNTHTGTGATNYGLYSTSDGNGFAITGNATSTGTGVNGISDSSNGGLFQSTSGTGMVGQSTSGLAGEFDIAPSSTNTNVPIVLLNRGTSGTAAAGMGGYLKYILKDASNNSQEAGRLGFEWVDATTGTRTTRGSLYAVNSTTTTEITAFDGTGVVGIGRFSSFGSTRLDIVDNGVAGANVVNISSTSTGATGNVQRLLNIALSGANSNNNQTTTSLNVTNSHSGTGNVNQAIFAQTTNGNSSSAAITGQTDLGKAISGVATGSSATAVSGSSVSGSGVVGSTTSGANAGQFSATPSSTNTYQTVVDLIRNTSGTAANGLGAQLRFEVGISNGSTAVAGDIGFQFTDVTTGTRTSRLDISTVNSAVEAVKFSITGAGSVLTAVNGALATNATDGFLYIPTCAGTPTGVPTTQTGMKALVWDSTNFKLYIYDNSTWNAMN